MVGAACEVELQRDAADDRYADEWICSRLSIQPTRVEVGRRQAHGSTGNSSSDFSNGGSTIALTLSSAIPDEAQVRVSYLRVSNGWLDASDAENALAAFDDSVVINGTADSTAPTLTSATVVGTAVEVELQRDAADNRYADE